MTIEDKMSLEYVRSIGAVELPSCLGYRLWAKEKMRYLVEGGRVAISYDVRDCVPKNAPGPKSVFDVTPTSGQQK